MRPARARRRREAARGALAGAASCMRACGAGCAATAACGRHVACRWRTAGGASARRDDGAGNGDPARRFARGRGVGGGRHDHHPTARRWESHVGATWAVRGACSARSRTPTSRSTRAAPAAAPRRHGRARLRLPPLSLSPGVLNFDFRLLLSRSPGRERGGGDRGPGLWVCLVAWGMASGGDLFPRASQFPGRPISLQPNSPPALACWIVLAARSQNSSTAKASERAYQRLHRMMT